jgi:hypothetical protein
MPILPVLSDHNSTASPKAAVIERGIWQISYLQECDLSSPPFFSLPSPDPSHSVIHRPEPSHLSLFLPAQPIVYLLLLFHASLLRPAKTSDNISERWMQAVNTETHRLLAVTICSAVSASTEYISFIALTSRFTCLSLDSPMSADVDGIGSLD